MFCLRILLLLHSSLQARGRTSFLMIISVLSTLVTTSLAAAPNKCIVSGTYLEVASAGASIGISPEDGTLKEVGQKACGFKFSGNPFSCTKHAKIEYIAVEVDIQDAYHCSFYNEIVVCVCPFFGCNSVTGVLYEALLNSISTLDDLKAEAHEDLMKPYMRGNSLECILGFVETFYASQDSSRTFTRGSLDELKRSPAKLNDLRTKSSWLFPNQQRVEFLKQLGIEKTTIEPSTTLQIETSTTTAEALGSDSLSNVQNTNTNTKTNPKGKNNGLKKLSLVLNVFLSLTAIAMIAFIVGFLVHRNKKKNSKKNDTKSPACEPSKFDFADPNGASKNRSVASSVAAGPSFQGPSVSSKK